MQSLSFTNESFDSCQISIHHFHISSSQLITADAEHFSGEHSCQRRALEPLPHLSGARSSRRHLSAKERAREAEREKLGLISKERQREMEILKKGGRKAMDEPMIMGTPGLDLITLGLVDADKIPNYDLTVEDGRRLAKEYSRVLMKKHRARQAAETNLLRLKKEAIEALPEKLKEAALIPDLTAFPANRFMATLTPPIEGYIEKVKEAAKKSSTKQKLR